MRYNHWLFDEQNRYAFTRNLILKSTFWIDPKWAVEETRALGDELASEEPVRQLELRQSMIEDAVMIFDAFKK